MAETKPKVGLALGGGGARGLAHLGVWEKLQEIGLSVGCIAGTSIGAIIGAIVSAGRVEDALEWCNEPDWRKIPKLVFDPHLTAKALTSGRRVEELLATLVGVRDFAELNLPFAAVAADFNTGEEVVMASGDLVSAVRASMSIPGIFLPVERDGRVLVDGQLVNPVPVSVCKAMGADVVVAVDINPPNSPDDAKPLSKIGILDVLSGTINLLNCELTRRTFRENRPDVLIRPDVGKVPAFDFRNAERLVEIGYDSVDDSVIDAIAGALEAARASS